jgi:hypothetical protein
MYVPAEHDVQLLPLSLSPALHLTGAAGIAGHVGIVGLFNIGIDDPRGHV